MVLLKICSIFSLTILSFAFALFLVTKKNVEKKNYWLGVVAILFCVINVVELSFYFPDAKQILAKYFGIILYEKNFLELLLLPFFYYYLTKFYKIKSVKFNDLGIYAVIGLFCGYMYFTKDAQTSITSANCYREIWTQQVNVLFAGIQMLQLIYYSIRIHNFLKIKEKQSSERIISWHKKLIFFIVLISVVKNIDETFSVFSMEVNAQIYMYIFTRLSMVLVFFGLFYLEAKYAFASQSIEVVKEKYANSGLNKKHINEILNNFKNYLNTKPYLEQDFSLDKVSSFLNVPKNYLSQVINQTYDYNFSELISRLRIKEVLILLENETYDEPIYQVYFNAGFNSKSVFNTAFKKYTGLTPTEYRDQKLNNAIAISLKKV